MTDWYDRAGNPIDVLEAERLLAGNLYKRVALTTLADGREVSTVWLGLDHNHTRSGPPLIFETMVFPPDSRDELYCARYPTEAAALAGHDRVVAAAAAGDPAYGEVRR